MKIFVLRSIIVKKFNHSGKSKTDEIKEYSNLLEQNFSASNPDREILFIRQKLVGLI